MSTSLPTEEVRAAAKIIVEQGEKSVFGGVAHSVSEDKREKLPESSFRFLATLAVLKRGTVYQVYREVKNREAHSGEVTSLPLQSAYRAAKQLSDAGHIESDGVIEPASNGVLRTYYVVTAKGWATLLGEAFRLFKMSLSFLTDGDKTSEKD